MPYGVITRNTWDDGWEWKVHHRVPANIQMMTYEDSWLAKPLLTHPPPLRFGRPFSSSYKIWALFLGWGGCYPCCRWESESQPSMNDLFQMGEESVTPEALKSAPLSSALLLASSVTLSKSLNLWGSVFSLIICFWPQRIIMILLGERMESK